MRWVLPRHPIAVLHPSTRLMSNSPSHGRCQSQDRPLLRRQPKTPNFNAFPVRKIALKFCYSGSEYSGLAYQEGPTPLPTVEGVLFNAMAQTFLVDRDGGLEGCGWERCGRTDRGVSAAGQVVSVWVRTALKTMGNVASSTSCETQETGMQKEDDGQVEQDPSPADSIASGILGEFAFAEDPLDDDGDRLFSSTAPSASPTSELRYVTMINRVLPPTIRVLAWSPVAPDFSARFACKYRHYKYFFSSHDLDIPRMRDAASRLVGEHDFRNLCKLDVAKQITRFRRRILRAEIGPVNPDNLPTVNECIHVLDLIGTAFLYHQVRHIMAVLFLVGAGLEHPSVISSLLNVTADHQESHRSGDPPLQIVDRKPEYQMADGLPLVLWECGYDESDVHWRTEIDDSVAGEQYGPSSSGIEIYRQLHSTYTRSLIRSTLDAHFLAAAAQYHSPPPLLSLQRHSSLLNGASVPSTTSTSEVVYIPLGGGTSRRAPNYVPLLSRNRLDSVEVANERWRLGKGLRKLERQRADRPFTSNVEHDDNDE